MLRKRYFWEGMYKDITHWIETCSTVLKLDVVGFLWHI